jgi:hypothetical protein
MQEQLGTRKEWLRKTADALTDAITWLTTLDADKPETQTER